jgi:hypothetical protein
MAQSIVQCRDKDSPVCKSKAVADSTSAIFCTKRR